MQLLEFVLRRARTNRNYNKKQTNKNHTEKTKTIASLTHTHTIAFVLYSHASNSRLYKSAAPNDADQQSSIAAAAVINEQTGNTNAKSAISASTKPCRIIIVVGHWRFVAWKSYPHYCCYCYCCDYDCECFCSAWQWQALRLNCSQKQVATAHTARLWHHCSCSIKKSEKINLINSKKKKNKIKTRYLRLRGPSKRTNLV